MHFVGAGRDEFADRQLQMAVQLGKPTIVASSVQAETRRGPIGSPDPIWLGQGNPTIAIANALDRGLGRGRREERSAGAGLGKTKLFLVFKEDEDYTLGLSLRQRIQNRGPFEVLEPKRDSADARYEELAQARAALLCWGKAGKSWIHKELDALNRATVHHKLYDMPRAVYLKTRSATGGIELVESDRLLRSEVELDSFLGELRTGAQGAVA